MTTCHDRRCTRPSRMAVRVTRPSPEKMIVTVWPDDQTAPGGQSVLRYCKEHGTKATADVLAVLVDFDEEGGGSAT